MSLGFLILPLPLTTKINRHYTDLMIFVGAGLLPAHNGGKHKALPLQNVNDFLIGINSNVSNNYLKALRRSRKLL